MAERIIKIEIYNTGEYMLYELHIFQDIKKKL